ncbi:MAG: hypothetical protein ACP5E4_01770, partial [Candidatus Aenigmatarchaeota archaeon]
VDTVAPNITSFTLRPSKVFIGETITGLCKAEDDVKGSFSGEITGIDTKISGKKTAVCTAEDYAGNIAVKFSDYEVVELVCEENKKRCSGGDLEICRENEWAFLQECDNGCDSKTLKCIEKKNDTAKTEPELPGEKPGDKGKGKAELPLDSPRMVAGVVLLLVIIAVMGVAYIKIFEKPRRDYTKKMAVLENKIREAEGKGKDVGKIRKDFELVESDIKVGLYEMVEPRIKEIEKALKKLK